MRANSQLHIKSFCKIMQKKKNVCRRKTTIFWISFSPLLLWCRCGSRPVKSPRCRRPSHIGTLWERAHSAVVPADGPPPRLKSCCVIKPTRLSTAARPFLPCMAPARLSPSASAARPPEPSWGKPQGSGEAYGRKRGLRCADAQKQRWEGPQAEGDGGMWESRPRGADERRMRGGAKGAAEGKRDETRGEGSGRTKSSCTRPALPRLATGWAQSISAPAVGAPRCGMISRRLR